jgi:hypothetical protein
VASDKWQVASRQNIPREAAAVNENLTNEPTDFSAFVVVSPYFRIIYNDYPVTEAKTNEPIFGPPCRVFFRSQNGRVHLPRARRSPCQITYEQEYDLEQ